MTNLRALSFLILAFLPFPAGAQDAASVSDVPVVEVTGVAPNDLLNLRATASAGGLIIARFENGAMLNNLGCADVNGINWCKVQYVDDPKLQGWAPARYLLDPATAGIQDAPMEDIPEEPAQ
ncbi:MULTISPECIES: SH3 domain-containing protein [Mesorhizobium]|uniref:SH3 domain-containing protein n=1 Tax=Mesorhizobium denitrificans TaxID=2294114 RepID=A0A371XE84_9HYPH|nr:MULTISPECIES: SH3 domain-containing protein [Mesorhizobium]RFC67549.1 SH3 domain-containing protein [Mesorhizobium denitrificans]